MASKTLVILDSQAILHRAYHALPYFTSPQGQLTGALYGFTAMLLKILRDLKPDYIAACYDLAKPTFRHIVYKQYKAHRPKTENELVLQIDTSKEILKRFNIPVYEKEGFEADDLIATIVEKTKKEKDLKIIIATGDLDALALVEQDKVKVYTLRQGIEEAAFYGQKEVEKRFGFPPEFISDFKGLKGDPSDNIPGVKGIGEKTASELIKKFGSLENILNKAKNNPEILQQAGFKERIIKALVQNEETALFSKALACLRKDLPIEFSLPSQFNWREFDKNKLIELFQSLGFKTFLARLSEVKPPTMTQKAFDFAGLPETKELGVKYWLLDSRRTNPKNEEILASLFPNEKISVELISKAEEILEKEIKEQGLERLFKEIEIPLIPIIERMEKNGILIDSEELNNQRKIFQDKTAEIKEEIFEIAGEKFNVNSPKEVRRILFEKLQIKNKRARKTGGGEISTATPELLKIASAHPIVEKIIKQRELQKLVSGYLEALPEHIGNDKRIHPKFNQTGTATGRLSCEEPNLQNIPLKGEGNLIRKIFIASMGFKLVSLDYSQIELRLAAHFSEDENLIKAFREDKDIHAITASKIFDLPEDKVDEEKRNFAKTINFGILYGMSARALAEAIGVSYEEARIFLDEYFKDFPKLFNYFESVKNSAREKGFLTTLFGRKRFIPEINSNIERIKREGERKALNFPIQGSAADLIKLSMVKIDEYLQKNNLIEKAKLILQIHDELIFEIKEEAASKIVPEIQKIMEEIHSLRIPLKTEIKSGNNWAELSLLI